MVQSRLTRAEEELRTKRKKSLALALEVFSESIDEMQMTLQSWLEQVKLMRSIINDKLKKL